jgi:hypothetical protein
MSEQTFYTRPRTRKPINFALRFVVLAMLLSGPQTAATMARATGVTEPYIGALLRQYRHHGAVRVAWVDRLDVRAGRRVWVLATDLIANNGGAP